MTLSGVEDIASSIPVTGSFTNGVITFGSSKASGPQITFEGGWTRTEGLTGKFTYAGNGGSWGGTWGDVLPGTPPAEPAVAEYVEPLPMFREERPPLQLDPNDPHAICQLLHDERTMFLMSSGGVQALHRICADDASAQSSCPSRKVAQASPWTWRRLFTILPNSLTGLLPSALATPPNIRANDPGTDTYPYSTQNEVSLAASGQDQHIIVAGYNDTYHVASPNTGIGFSRSTNKGAAWADRGPLLPGSGNDINGDPVVASALNGDFYFASLLHFSGLPGLRIGVARSIDGGVTFGTPPVNASPNETTVAAADKPEMAVDRTSTSPYSGNIYVCWTSFSLGGIRFSRSTNQGNTFVQYGSSVSDSTAVQGCSIAVGPQGDVYVGWWDAMTNMIRVRRSIDGGASFIAFEEPVDTAISPDADFCCDPSGVPTINGHIRAQPNANLAGDPLLPGNVYAAWQSVDAGSIDVYFSRSTNYGFTWSARKRLNDVVDKAQFFPRMATGVLFEANPHRTVIKVTWYDRRQDSNNLAMQLFADSSGDGGVTWGTDVQWTDTVSPLPELCPDYFDCSQPLCYFGDYNGLASLNPLSSEFVLGWGDTREVAGGNPDCANGTSSQDPNVYTAVGC